MIIKIAINVILNDLKWSRNLFQFWKKISYDRDATIGKIIIDWAIIIAYGVYKISKTPKTPSLASRKYTIKPTTTGGMPIKAFKVTIIEVFK